MSSNEPNLKSEPNFFSLADIRSLAKIVSHYDLSELELERQDERLCIRRDRNVVPTPSTAASVTIPTAEPSVTLSAPAAAPAEEAKDDGSTLITSPFVGMFYRAPSPESPPFVELGQDVRKGQSLCIVEAMKLMNEIEAEVDCRILEILVKNAELVEFGQPLFRVIPQA